MLRTIAAAAALLASAACSHPLDVRVEADAPPWLTAPGVVERTKAAARAAAAAWGSPGDDLQDVTVRLVTQVHGCGEDSRDDGCTEDKGAFWIHEWEAQVDAVGACVEVTVLAHEIGHVVLAGDVGHKDPRWCDFGFWLKMAVALAPSAQGDPACLAALPAIGLREIGRSYCNVTAP